MRVIGLDIGGANLKASDGEHRSVSRPFAIWREPDRLSGELQSLLGEFRRPQHLAVTMTAELADCFATKAEGIDRILTAVEAAVDVPIHVWQQGGEFVTPADARELPRLVAAANWHALATWVGRMTPQGAALLIDVGSTTTDIIPLFEGLPATKGGTDVERLAAGELVYTGVRRTPVCAVARSVLLPDSMGLGRSPTDVPLHRSGTREVPTGTGTACPAEAVPMSDDGPISAGHAVARLVDSNRRIPLAGELFATIHDVALILGDAEEDVTNLDTADGRPATIDHARSRLARMLCCDQTELTDNELTQVAVQLRDAQLQQLAAALTRVLQNMQATPASLLLSGEGDRTIRRLIARLPAFASSQKHPSPKRKRREKPSERPPPFACASGYEDSGQIDSEYVLTTIPTLSLRDALGPQHSTAACAYALARLGKERIR